MSPELHGKPAFFLLTMKSGALLGPGQVQGAGGPIVWHATPHPADRLLSECRRAREGKPLLIYEPRPGHALFFILEGVQPIFPRSEKPPEITASIRHVLVNLCEVERLAVVSPDDPRIRTPLL